MIMVDEQAAVRSAGCGITCGALLAHAGVTGSGLDAGLLGTPVTGVHFDSREVDPGGVFVAVPGRRFDGVDFVDEAVERGAALVVAEVAPPAAAPRSWVRVPDGRAALAALAAAFHGDPSRELLVAGITGTNGKTTTTYLLESIFEHAGIATGRISSISNRVGRDEAESPAVHTTPEAPQVQALLAAMRDRGARACVMEVSSHAAALRRVDHVRFTAAVFTNLTRDHLDFHGDMEGYFAAKRRLFELLPDGAPAVVNVDDPRGARLAAQAVRPVTYAVDRTADCMPVRLELRADGTLIEARTPRGRLLLESPLLGRTAAYNVLAAAATGVALDLPFSGIAAGVRALAMVPGRMQRVSSHADDVTVIVDSAHTDDALRGLLEAVRRFARGKVVTVFGCGGDRDATKRPLMGVVATRLSDAVVLTSDNPRSEDPDAIIDDIKRGISRSDTPHLAIVDRAAAIGRAIDDAAAGDVIVIAGKGHERYQVIGLRAAPFDDAVVARAALDARRGRLFAG
jgi:UDP-N-acetylmuramoyl-L-alanyl-D-glutamate--2,6-diaminopimelate ligase